MAFEDFVITDRGDAEEGVAGGEIEDESRGKAQGHEPSRDSHRAHAPPTPGSTGTGAISAGAVEC